MQDSTSRDFLLEAMPKYSVCAEIGVHRGEFSSSILKIVSPQKLHLIDPWFYESDEVYQNSWYGGAKGKNQSEMDCRYDHVVKSFHSAIQAGQVVIHRERSKQACAEFPDGYFDWIYIDGNHLYEFVKADLELYTPKVAAGGWITGDDYESDGWWNDGVKRAVDEVVGQGFVTMCQIRNGQFILRKGSPLSLFESPDSDPR